MIFRLGLIVLALFLPWTVRAGTLSVEPGIVATGELGVVRWHGEVPSFGVVRFGERVVYFSPDPEGAVALLPVGLDHPPGQYPLLVAVVDRWGTTTAAELALEVVDKSRPLERLTLPQGMVSPRDPAVLARIQQERIRLEELFGVRSERLWKGFRPPVADPVNSVFGKRRLLNGQPRAPHSGTDFRSPRGTPVRAIADGRVTLVDDLFYTGKTVVLDHGGGLFSLYAHLSATAVLVDELVAGGDMLGQVGSTGRSTGPHLHLTVKLLGERIDPMALIRLLPAEDS